ncbi:uncharacterized protein Z518_01617 [Rhinocladiella mackenziei CBS 650.93]|uniref:Rhinocladiella mackenziei CBS 650.93 unplaced genomic scaffold supercont1.1, whole genome shotgun sequence n=1 Tax=Rhinocladiella mackenziei CBS 650.93 TaxID=1442369 RepID=A0A0D2IX21_9EURO|nr:uncharacterized protein Z518_01617 [Rhinocladiella mackenziei CBS 650.93]KIX10534.1 hypothetical protein Z518_01617 [Rhinocladiella mackenziei CBS 650.93]
MRTKTEYNSPRSMGIQISPSSLPLSANSLCLASCAETKSHEIIDPPPKYQQPLEDNTYRQQLTRRIADFAHRTGGLQVLNQTDFTLQQLSASMSEVNENVKGQQGVYLPEIRGFKNSNQRRSEIRASEMNDFWAQELNYGEDIRNKSHTLLLP